MHATGFKGTGRGQEEYHQDICQEDRFDPKVVGVQEICIHNEEAQDQPEKVRFDREEDQKQEKDCHQEEDHHADFKKENRHQEEISLQIEGIKLEGEEKSHREESSDAHSREKEENGQTEETALEAGPGENHQGPICSGGRNRGHR